MLPACRAFRRFARIHVDQHPGMAFEMIDEQLLQGFGLGVGFIEKVVFG